CSSNLERAIVLAMSQRVTAIGEPDVLDGETPFEGRLRSLLRGVAEGSITPEQAAAALRDLPFADLGFARVDHHRELRQGSCEIVYGSGKSAGQVAAIVHQLLEGNEGPVLVTRTGPEQAEAVRAEAAAVGLDVLDRPTCGALAILRNVPAPVGRVLVVTACTSDLGVAEEAVLTATVMGADVEMVADVGVAGLHRLAAVRTWAEAADAHSAAAGLEGPLPSAGRGLLARPGV